MNQYSRSAGSTSSQAFASPFSSPFPSNRTGKSSSPTIPFSPIRKNLIFQDSSNNNSDDDAVNIPVKSGEEALSYLGE